MRKIHWKVTIVDGGDYREYTKDILVEGYKMLTSLDDEIGNMYPNSIHSLKVEYIDTVYE